MKPNQIARIVIYTFFLAASFIFANAVEQPCGNGNLGGTSAKPDEKKSSKDPFDAYTGNDFRDVSDLTVWGSVGDKELEFKRYSISRFNGSSIQKFGQGSQWRHNFQFEVGDNGVDFLGRKRIKIFYP